MNDDSAGKRTEKEIFFEALDKNTPQERAAFLDGACGRDPLLRRRVEGLLANHFERHSFMEQAAAELPTVFAQAPLSEGPGSTIGRYKLLEKLGEGGFGAVYVAEQREPVKRRVALKTIQLGMDTQQVVARFEAERQALALMDHPNIAKVLDAGATETPQPASDHPLPVGRGEGLAYLPAGRPYFVMELVRGVPMTK